MLLGRREGGRAGAGRRRFEADSRAFHAALATDRRGGGAGGRSAGELGAGAGTCLRGAQLQRAETLAILDAGWSATRRARAYTDYERRAQAVMALDTLLNAPGRPGQVSTGAAAAMRPDIDRAYRAVRDPNAYPSRRVPRPDRSASPHAVRSLR